MYTDYIWMDLSELEVSSTNQGSSGLAREKWRDLTDERFVEKD